METIILILAFHKKVLTHTNSAETRRDCGTDSFIIVRKGRLYYEPLTRSLHTCCIRESIISRIIAFKETRSISNENHTAFFVLLNLDFKHGQCAQPSCDDKAIVLTVI